MSEMLDISFCDLIDYFGKQIKIHCTNVLRVLVPRTNRTVGRADIGVFYCYLTASYPHTIAVYHVTGRRSSRQAHIRHHP